MGLELAKRIIKQCTIRDISPYEIQDLPRRLLEDRKETDSIALRKPMLPEKHDETGPSICCKWVHDQRNSSTRKMNGSMIGDAYNRMGVDVGNGDSGRLLFTTYITNSSNKTFVIGNIDFA